MRRNFVVKPAMVFFDAVGTLIFPDPSFENVYAEVSERLGGKRFVEDIRRRFGDAFARQEKIDAMNAWITSEAREEQRWRNIVAEVLDDIGDSEAGFSMLYDHFGRPDAWRVHPAAQKVFSCLESQGLRLGLASNFDRRLHRIIAGHESLKRLHPIVISSEVGRRKPAAPFFHYLGTHTGLAPESILFVGDDWTNDYLGARQSGLSALLLDPNRKHPELGKNRLESLEDLAKEWIIGQSIGINS